jgi:hypothetical protein
MTKETNNPKEASTPKYHAYTVIAGPRKGQKASWHRIGAVFAHDDGEGETLILHSLPIDGRVVMRAPKTEQAEDQQDQPTVD